MELERNLKDLSVSRRNDQDEIRRQLWVLRMLMSRGDYDLARKTCTWLLAFLDSHLAREESRARSAVTVSPSLSFLENKSATVFRNEQFIESLIRKRKATYDSFREIQHLTRFSSDVERFSCFDKFERTLLNCLSQENSAVMPVSFETNKEGRGTIAREEKNPQGLVLIS